jgi:hypothetical protein
MTAPVAVQPGPSLKQPQGQGLEAGRCQAPGMASPQRAGVCLPVFKGEGGLVDGLDPSSNASILDALGDVA